MPTAYLRYSSRQRDTPTDRAWQPTPSEAEVLGERGGNLNNERERERDRKIETDFWDVK